MEAYRSKLIFPKDFIFGVANSAAQVEGAAKEEGMRHQDGRRTITCCLPME